MKTGAGLSARGLAGPVTGQGAGGAALASSLNLDKRLDNYFRGSKDEECYVDDVIRGAYNVNCLRAGCVKLDFVLKEKQLEANPTKSGFLVTGSERFKAKGQKDVKEKLLGNIVLKEMTCDSYLGDKLSREGLKCSIEATIKDKMEVEVERQKEAFMSFGHLLKTLGCKQLVDSRLESTCMSHA